MCNNDEGAVILIGDSESGCSKNKDSNKEDVRKVKNLVLDKKELIKKLER